MAGTQRPDSSANNGTTVDSLRTALLNDLQEREAISCPLVTDAFRAVARHQFLPGVPLETAYASDEVVVLKRDADGVAISSVSAAWLVATMLEQLQVEPGHRVLEIGSGGHNAALLAELVGPQGSVTTIDIDPDVVERARTTLTAAGYPQVRVLQADGEFGAKEHSPYDRIMITVGGWDVPPAWTEQLADDGRLVVPLRMRGLTRSIAFEREGEHLASRGYVLCGFVPMQGAGANRERLVPLQGDDVGLRVDDGQQVDANALSQALSAPRTEEWSGLMVGAGVRFDGLHLWLAMALPGFGLLQVSEAAAKRGIVSHAWRLGIPTAIDGNSFAHLTLRLTDPEQRLYEFGAHGYGPSGGKLANEMVQHIQSWDGNSLNARIEVHPASAPDDHFSEGALVINKRHTRVAVTWPGGHRRTNRLIVGCDCQQ